MGKAAPCENEGSRRRSSRNLCGHGAWGEVEDGDDGKGKGCGYVLRKKIRLRFLIRLGDENEAFI